MVPEAGRRVAVGEVGDKDDGEDEGEPLDGVLEGAEVRLRGLAHLEHLLDEVHAGHDEDAQLPHLLAAALHDVRQGPDWQFNKMCFA